MSWLNVLSETYDNCVSAVGVKDENGAVLLPLSHSTAEAQLEIVIDLQGNFIRAERVEKPYATTIIPVTEDSATRSSGIAPMPLCDKLQYIAGDYDRECSPKKSMRECYEAYIEALTKWTETEFAGPEIRAVLAYVKRESVIADLKRNGKFDAAEDFVRFIVYDGKIERGVWNDKNLYKQFHQYYMNTITDRTVCFDTGGNGVPAHKFPAKIRNTGDKAKLISSNDSHGYTFRGRFKTADDAVAVGYETSQKAHNALRWLIKKQGYRNGSESIVCWASEGGKVPNIMDGSVVLFGIEEEDEVDTAERYAERVNRALRGYKDARTDFISDTNINVMAVDTADGSSQGRLSIVYYGEFRSSEFYENIEYWYSGCLWQHNYHKDEHGKYPYYIGTPSPKEIALSAFGTEQGNILKSDDKVEKKCIDRILPCIIQRKRFPKDIMRAAVRNASEPQRYSGFNWNRILSNTCAIIRKCQVDDGKEGYDMSLKGGGKDRDRDYQFGRLLAILNRIEQVTYFKDGNSRETNAMKYWSAFARKPARTFSILRERLTPYISKLHEGQKNKYEILIEDVLGNLAEIDGYTNEQLRENYLLGYYNQDAAFRTAVKEKEDDEV